LPATQSVGGLQWLKENRDTPRQGMEAHETFAAGIVHNWRPRVGFSFDAPLSGLNNKLLPMPAIISKGHRG
jgi:hypothetical protein